MRCALLGLECKPTGAGLGSPGVVVEGLLKGSSHVLALSALQPADVAERGPEPLPVKEERLRDGGPGSEPQGGARSSGERKSVGRGVGKGRVVVSFTPRVKMHTLIQAALGASDYFTPYRPHTVLQESQ